MDMELDHEQFRPDGIFGSMNSDDDSWSCVTITHAFEQPDGSFAPILQPGTYTCQRGTHTLGSGQKVETFEIMNVPGHTGILFHPGNFNTSSDGCECVGQAIADDGSEEMITNSDVTFASFMALQQGVDQFNLTVT